MLTITASKQAGYDNSKFFTARCYASDFLRQIFTSDF